MLAQQVGEFQDSFAGKGVGEYRNIELALPDGVPRFLLIARRNHLESPGPEHFSAIERQLSNTAEQQYTVGAS